MIVQLIVAPLMLQIAGEARHRDVHGGDVEDDHQLGDQQHRQQPAVRLAGSASVRVDRVVVLGVLRLVVHGLTPPKLDGTVRANKSDISVRCQETG